ALAAALLLGSAGGTAAETVLRVTPHANLQVLDPHTNTATITVMHAHLIFDTLFAYDEKLSPKPQMVESYTVSPDKLTYDFVLRPGRKFHDGHPVTTRDVLASLQRWMVRDGLGQKLKEFTAEIGAQDDTRFRLKLKEPFPFVEFALASSSGQVPAIMRAKE